MSARPLKVAQRSYASDLSTKEIAAGPRHYGDSSFPRGFGWTYVEPIDILFDEPLEVFE